MQERLDLHLQALQQQLQLVPGRAQQIDEVGCRTNRCCRFSSSSAIALRRRATSVSRVQTPGPLTMPRSVAVFAGRRPFATRKPSRTSSGTELPLQGVLVAPRGGGALARRDRDRIVDHPRLGAGSPPVGMGPHWRSDLRPGTPPVTINLRRGAPIATGNAGIEINTRALRLVLARAIWVRTVTR